MLHLNMKGNACHSQQKRISPATEFLKATRKANIPANVFVVVDTHSDAHTGNLQHAGGVSSALVAPVDEVRHSLKIRGLAKRIAGFEALFWGGFFQTELPRKFNWQEESGKTRTLGDHSPGYKDHECRWFASALLDILRPMHPEPGAFSAHPTVCYPVSPKFFFHI